MNETAQNRREMNQVLRGIEMDELDIATKEFVIDAYNTAKNSALNPEHSGKFHKKALYWGLFCVVAILIVNIIFDIVKVPNLYYAVFCVAILSNLSFIWLKTYKDRIADIRSVMENWDMLPDMGKKSFMQNIHTQIDENMHSMPINEKMLSWIQYGIYAISIVALSNVFWQDRGFSVRGLFIFLLCLILIVVAHMHISVQREWHLFGVVDDKKLLESYYHTLIYGYEKMVVLLGIIIFVVSMFCVWLFFGNIISQYWEYLF